MNGNLSFCPVSLYLYLEGENEGLYDLTLPSMDIPAESGESKRRLTIPHSFPRPELEVVDGIATSFPIEGKFGLRGGDLVLTAGPFTSSEREYRELVKQHAAKPFSRNLAVSPVLLPRTYSRMGLHYVAVVIRADGSGFLLPAGSKSRKGFVFASPATGKYEVIRRGAKALARKYLVLAKNQPEVFPLVKR